MEKLLGSGNALLRRKRPKPTKLIPSVKIPRSMRSPCNRCHWRLVETCTLGYNPENGVCSQWMEEIVRDEDAI